jgi:hypothetical protein
MNAESGAFVRGFADLEDGRAGVAWGIAGGGAVTLEGGKASAAGVDAVDPGSDERWSFYTPLDGDPLRSATIFRHITVETAEGMIVCTATGPQGIAGHGDEHTSARLRAGGEDVPYEEALISTQYDGGGDPTRFGLELWPPDADQTTRAAATRVSGSLLGGASSGGAWAGLFRCHTDGFEGAGTYLLWRA